MITLPKLPFKKTDLEPHISEKTITVHYEKHHAGYVKNLNMLIKDTKYENMDLEDIVKKSSTGTIFNNAAQVWNHTFFWNCLSPNSKESDIVDGLTKAIDDKFGSLEKFKKQFIEQGKKVFGAGWIWLMWEQKGNEGKLYIDWSQNAGTPMVGPNRPLLVCDLWEHSYYLDYQNDREKYLESFWKIIDWKKVSSNFKSKD